jgi:hypothetical protein
MANANYAVHELAQKGLLDSATQFYRVRAIGADGSITAERMRDGRCITMPANTLHLRDLAVGVLAEIKGNRVFKADTRNVDFARRAA